MSALRKLQITALILAIGWTGQLAAVPECPLDRAYELCFRDLTSREEGLPREDSTPAPHWGAALEDVYGAADAQSAAQRAARHLDGAHERVAEIQPGGPIATALAGAVAWYRARGSTETAPESRTGVFIGEWTSNGRYHTNASRALFPDCYDQTPRTAAARCSDIFTEAVRLADEVWFAWAVINAAEAGNRAEAHALIVRTNQQWDAYFYSTGYQYFWELLWNRSLVAGDTKILHDEHGNELGMREVPKRRRIFLHPDVGVTFLPDGASGERFAPAVTLQWYGALRWSGFDGEQVTGMRGLALTSAWADRGEGTKLGHGVTLYSGDYALTLTTHGGDIAATFNLALGDKTMGIDQKWKERFKSATFGTLGSP